MKQTKQDGPFTNAGGSKTGELGTPEGLRHPPTEKVIERGGRKYAALPARECAAANCNVVFVPQIGSKEYCSAKCQGREKQRRLRARAKLGIRG